MALLCFFALFMEYHFFPFGRGWLIWCILYFKTLVILWTRLRTAIFERQAGYFGARLYLGFIGFMIIAMINAVIHSLVQNGMKADYDLEIETNEKFKQEEIVRRNAERDSVMLSTSEDEAVRLTSNILEEFRFPGFMRQIIILDNTFWRGTICEFKTLKYSKSDLFEIWNKLHLDDQRSISEVSRKMTGDWDS